MKNGTKSPFSSSPIILSSPFLSLVIFNSLTLPIFHHPPKPSQISVLCDIFSRLLSLTPVGATIKSAPQTENPVGVSGKVCQSLSIHLSLSHDSLVKSGVGEIWAYFSHYTEKSLFLIFLPQIFMKRSHKTIL